MKKNKPPQHPVLRRSNFLVVITARGGSKGIPHKNIVKLAGRPLVEYSIRAARGSRYFRDFDLMCSTEDAKIARVARACGCAVPFLRPKKLAGDRTKSMDVILHDLKKMEILEGKRYDYVILLQPTSPLRTAKHLDEAITLALKHKNKCDAVASVVEPRHLPYQLRQIGPKGYLKHYLKAAAQYTRRQDNAGVLALNGAIYITRRDVILKQKSFYGTRCLPYIMGPEASVDIDTPADLAYAEFLLSRRRKNEL